MDLLQEAIDLLEELIERARKANETSELGPLIEAQNLLVNALLHPSR